MEVRAAAETSVSGKRSSTVFLKTDGGGRVTLDAQMSHSIRRGHRALGLRLNLAQNLLPSVPVLHLNMAANMSSDRSVLRYLLLLILRSEACNIINYKMNMWSGLRFFF